KHELLEGVGAQGAHGIDLLSHSHTSHFSRHTSANATTDDHRCHRWRHLTGKRERNDSWRVFHPTKLAQTECELHRHHHADEDARHKDDPQGGNTHCLNLLNDSLPFEGSSKSTSHRANAHAGQLAHMRNQHQDTVYPSFKQGWNGFAYHEPALKGRTPSSWRREERRTLSRSV